MTGDPRPLSTDERIRHRVARLVAQGAVLLLLLALLIAWVTTGFYQLSPGEAAVVLRFGAHVGTEAREGLRWHLPPPIEVHEVVQTGRIEREEFGAPGVEGDPVGAALAEAKMQTSDNNIVQLGFVVQYKVRDAFESRYRLANATQTVRDAAEAAVRRVVGRNTIDGVLSERRGQVESEAREILQQNLDRYDSGLFVTDVRLLEVQPPAPVREAFDDVISARQDRNRKINEAQGYENEVIPQARAESTELVEAANAYRDAMIADAEGQAQRFLAIAREYKKAPAITRKRMYLETMEEILPQAEKVIIEPGTAAVLPYLPLGAAPGLAPR